LGQYKLTKTIVDDEEYVGIYTYKNQSVWY